MITKELMNKAEERCLEIVNDGRCHAKYHPVFKQQLDTYGAEALRQAAAFAKQGKWGWLNGTWPDSETSKWTYVRLQCEMAGDGGTAQSRVVFGLVLEHWLCSNVPAPAKPVPSCKPKLKVGDTVRILTERSYGGSYKLKKGSIHTIYKEDDWIDGVKCFVVEGSFYKPEMLELVNQPVTYEEICDTLDKYFPPAPQGTPKETVMLKITHATYVNGTDVKTLSVDALVGLISTTEKEIEKLEALGSKPKKVLKKIEDLKEGLAELVKIADED